MTEDKYDVIIEKGYTKKLLKISFISDKAKDFGKETNLIKEENNFQIFRYSIRHVKKLLELYELNYLVKEIKD